MAKPEETQKTRDRDDEAKRKPEERDPLLPTSVTRRGVT